MDSGPAKGAVASLLPVAENSGTPVGWSLQRVGGAAEWSWIAAAESPGTLNAGLQLEPAGRVPAAGLPLLFFAGGLAWVLSRRTSGWRTA